MYGQFAPKDHQTFSSKSVSAEENWILFPSYFVNKHMKHKLIVSFW